MKTVLIRLAVAATLSVAATAAHANYYCATSSVTARSGPGSSYDSVGTLKAGSRVYGLWSIHGWRKIVRPSGGLYFVPAKSLKVGECPKRSRKSVVYSAPRHKRHHGHW